MIQEFFSWLLATFVLDPVQTEITQRMQDAKAPIAVVQQVKTCVRSATPILVDRATNDVWWGLSTTISVMIGFTDAKTLLAETSPACAAAVSAARPFAGGLGTAMTLANARSTSTTSGVAL
jgi:uncharacterized alpha-E superfamily protein